jgi:protein O-mannosyl-transferase
VRITEHGVWPTRWLYLSLLVVVGLLAIALAWLPAAGAPYQYDDYITPVKDPASQSLSSFAGSVPGTLRPLTKLTFAAESSLGVRDATGRRALNGVLFVISAALLAQLARLSGLGTKAALAIATLWACHPVHAELVVALAGRSVLLALCLMLASAMFLVQKRTGPALVCAVLALFARETAWPWLVVCAGLSAGPRGRTRILAVVALTTALGGMLVLSSRLRELLVFSYQDASALNRLGLQWAALPRGLLLWLFEPDAFAVDIEFVPRGWLRFGYVLGALALYGLAGWLALRRGASRAERVAALLWLCLVVPLHSVVPKLDPLTARDVSASSAAIVMLVAAPLARGLAWSERAITRTRAPIAFWLSVTALLVGLVSLSRERAKLYLDPIALWSDAAARSRQKTRPLINLGTLLAQNGRLSEARRALVEANRRNPKDSEARERLAAVQVLIETKKLLTVPDRSATIER